MKPYRVVIPAVVKDQITAQLLLIAEDSIDNALAWGDRLKSDIEKIGKSPRGYPVDEEASARLGTTVRKMVFERTYLVHYLIDEGARVVGIINFRHGARLPRRGEP